MPEKSINFQLYDQYSIVQLVSLKVLVIRLKPLS